MWRAEKSATSVSNASPGYAASDSASLPNAGGLSAPIDRRLPGLPQCNFESPAATAATAVEKLLLLSARIVASLCAPPAFCDCVRGAAAFLYTRHRFTATPHKTYSVRFKPSSYSLLITF